jgi:hypothetical protein
MHHDLKIFDIFWWLCADEWTRLPPRAQSLIAAGQKSLTELDLRRWRWLGARMGNKGRNVQVCWK